MTSSSAAYGQPAQVPGTPAPPAGPRRGSALPWVLVAVLAVVAVVLGVLLGVRSGGAGDSEQQGFATPEEAVEFSTEQIAEGDAAGALTAWATDAQAENLDLVDTLERLRAFTPADTSSLPSDDELFVGLAKTTRAGAAAEQYRRMTISLLLPDVDLDSTTPLEKGDFSAQDIVDGLDSARLAGLTTQRIDQVKGPGKLDENLAEAAKLVGADESREYVVLYELDGETYLGGVGVLRYGDDWQIDSLQSSFAGTAYGSLQAITSEEYDDLVADFSS